MEFVDQAKIIVRAGDGGRGCSSVRKFRFARHPHRDGGGGGDGGDVVLVADRNVNTLLDVQYRHAFKAVRGQHGRGSNMTGRGGEDCTIRVPVGTVIRDGQHGAILYDLTRCEDTVVIATGGRGGVGNATGMEAQPGQLGETRALRLELKLLADVGIVGFPNSGKSSLLARISTARPKVAGYLFTTRVPVLGVVDVPAREPFVACDIPGLIEGAHEGKGLGIQFLRHIERTRLLVHLIDLAGVDGRDPIDAYFGLNDELGAYAEALRTRPQLIVANKMDLPDAAVNLPRFTAALARECADGERPRIWTISCASGRGISQLLRAVSEALGRLPAVSALTE